MVVIVVIRESGLTIIELELELGSSEKPNGTKTLSIQQA